MRVRILIGDCRERLRELPDNSVHCVVTSPPYFNLRDYHMDQQIGMEALPGDFVAQMVAVFREVRRVLRKDGTLWLNLGDSYAGSRSGPQGKFGEFANRSLASQREMRAADGSFTARAGAGAKNLLGIPWRVAFALQDDGWYLRQEIIWHKPNANPESVKDRCTKAHESVFIMTKTDRYFFDQDAIAVPLARSSVARLQQDIEAQIGSERIPGKTNGNMKAVGNGAKANRRSVWTISTQPFSGPHFAIMPPDLARDCILAGSSAFGCCAACGAPFTRDVELGEPDIEAQRQCGGDAAGEYHGLSTKDHAASGIQDASDIKRRTLAGMRVKRTRGWLPTCDCPEQPAVPCTVLDPFGGAGTTALCADRINRDSIMIELNPEYAAMAEERIRAEATLMTNIEVHP